MYTTYIIVLYFNRLGIVLRIKYAFNHLNGTKNVIPFIPLSNTYTRSLSHYDTSNTLSSKCSL